MPWFIPTAVPMKSAGQHSSSTSNIISPEAMSPRPATATRPGRASAHADKAAEAFKHWDAEGSVPTSCAKCHSTPGYKDYIGADGSAFNVVDKAAPLGTAVECEACHADPGRGIVHNHTSVVFPSGVEIKDLGPEALCMECHQGRASTQSVDTSIASSGAASDDAPRSKPRFITAP